MAKRNPEPSGENRTILNKSRESFQKELEARIDIGNELFERKIQSVVELATLGKNFEDWDDYNEELLRRSFNKIQNEYFADYHNCTQLLGVDDVLLRRNTETPQYKVNHLKKRIETRIQALSQLIKKLPLIAEDTLIQSVTPKIKEHYQIGFIIHGHNELRKLEVARFIENDLGLKSIILHEKPNQGKTIIEKFENYSSVDFAVAIWTGDDEGKSKTEDLLKDRARQNVIFETGYFIGKLGREYVIVLFESGVEIPSDYSGVIFINFSDNWKDHLRREIMAIYNI